MRTFIKSWIPQCLRILRSPCRLFHGSSRVLTSQIISHYDSINQCKKELPEYFNFASDVLDEWSQLEKVVFFRLLHRHWNKSQMIQINFPDGYWIIVAAE